MVSERDRERERESINEFEGECTFVNTLNVKKLY